MLEKVNKSFNKLHCKVIFYVPSARWQVGKAKHSVYVRRKWILRILGVFYCSFFPNKITFKFFFLSEANSDAVNEV